jgi:phosphoglycerate kinase
LNKALAPEAPSVLVMGGIKFETKLPLIEKLLPRYSHVLLAGGLLNTVLQRRHVKIGKSVFDEAADIDSLLLNSKLVIPERVIVLRGGAMHEIPIDEIQDEDTIVDIALDVLIRNTIGAAKTIVWNGPLGWYEKNAVSGSRALLELCNPTYQFVVAGGGDTVTLIKELNQESSVSFLSTGGGAMLEYLEYETLPGIKALG